MTFKHDSEGPRHVHECDDCKPTHTRALKLALNLLAEMLERADMRYPHFEAGEGAHLLNEVRAFLLEHKGK